MCPHPNHHRQTNNATGNGHDATLEMRALDKLLACTGITGAGQYAEAEAEEEGRPSSFSSYRGVQARPRRRQTAAKVYKI